MKSRNASDEQPCSKDALYRSLAANIVALLDNPVCPAELRELLLDHINETFNVAGTYTSIDFINAFFPQAQQQADSLSRKAKEVRR